MQIVPRLDAGGSEQSALEINEALTATEALSIVVSEGGRLARTIAEAGGANITLPVASKNPLVMYKNIAALRKLIREHQVSLVHARSRAPAWSALFAARREGVPFVTTYHGSYMSPAPFKQTYNSVMARGDITIANSRYTAELIHQRHHTPYEHISVVPRGIDPAKFNPRAISAERLNVLRGLWEIKPGDLIVLHAARLTEWKGQRYLIEAAAQLQQSNRLGRGVIIMAGALQGRDKYYQDLRTLISTLGLRGTVRIVGHCDDMPAAHALAHVTVIASSAPETFGRSSIEAQAMECPVIATDIGAVPETLVTPQAGGDAFTGWLVPPEDSTALADRLAQALLLTPEQRAAIGARARKHVAQRFSLAAMQYRTLAVYDRLLGTNLASQFQKSITKLP